MPTPNKMYTNVTAELALLSGVLSTIPLMIWTA